RWLGQILRRGGMAQSAGVVFIGGATARLLGFLFSVATARLLVPSEFGRMIYVLAVVAVASVFMTSAPQGLSRFLSLHRDDPSAQAAAYTNWLAVVAVILVLSIALAPAVGFVARTSAVMTVGVVANLFGIAVLATYREVQRGLGRYGVMMAFYVLANLLQLVVVVALGLAGWRSAELFVVVYGLSSVVALVVVQLAAPLHLRFSPGALSWSLMLGTLRFNRWILLQSVFFAVWYSADLLVVGRIVSSSAAGNYGTAKTFALALSLAPGAIATIMLPQVARLPPQSVTRYLLRSLAFAAAVTVPPALALAMLGRPLILLLFGGKYADASQPLVVLAIGMTAYGFYFVLGSLWIGLGRPLIDMLATGTGMMTTVVLAVILVPEHALAGGAIAFTAGSTIRLIVIGAYTWWELSRGSWKAHPTLGSEAGGPVVPGNDEPPPTAPRG
ncbi:MAG: oligosaccharide flippase family protein, partial [Candidatus Dormibacteraeota bacterium]|nr:oligosaccharide flippase family protein [Candidatus Dormibacteraeota bacterium]